MDTFGDVISLTPLHEVVDLTSVGCFIIVCDQTDYSGVICKLDDGVGVVPSHTVMRIQGVEERAHQLT